ncbi:MAG: Y-family DNA polymerase [Acidobacteriota bacterium]|nr:Y-family DNA polymerase [Acidobacteriota bacterium]
MTMTRLMPPIFAHIDCNNFYVSCEQTFDARLVGHPVIVLSNNDGCVIARSEAAKLLDVRMGVPLFQIEDLVRRHAIAVRSSNYALYGDMSQRVMQCLDDFSPHVEVYSIDEAFIDFSHVPPNRLTDVGQLLRARVRKWTGLPVSVGVAASKTLAKIANRHAKKSPKTNGVLSLVDSPHIDLALERIAVADVWGIGPAYTHWLRRRDITTARALRDADEYEIRRRMGVVGVHIVRELQGTSCLALEECPPPRHSVAVSRSFSRPVVLLSELREAVALFTTRAAEKLRRRNLAAGALTVFVATDRFNRGPQYRASTTVEIAHPSDATPELLRVALHATEELYREDREFKKAGVVCTALVPTDTLQVRLWNQEKWDRLRGVMKAVDGVNARFGPDTVRSAAVGYQQTWRSRAAHRSPRYTTQWDELLCVE